MSDDLVAFLRARLDEDEATVSYAGPARVAWLTLHDGEGRMLYTTVAASDGDGDPWVADGKEVAEPALARVVYDPARALREVEAKRAVLERHCIDVAKVSAPPYDPYTGERRPDEYNVDCVVCGWVSHNPGQACYTLHALAAVYSGHPDYRDEWKP